ncbi:MAG: DUF3108 domain-containing protein [Saprospiraceae bacterium]|nr:DUF3108 domain-containing protein [Saprospiraceae bacterium]
MLHIVLMLSCTLIATPRIDPTEAYDYEFAEEQPCSVVNSVFNPGEKIVYKIYYNWGFIWIAAGEVVFNVVDKGDQYHISAAGRTYKSYDWVFKVRDYYDSYVAKETLLPKRTIRKVLEGNYRLYDDVTYQHHRSKAISKKGKSAEDLETEEVTLNGCTHDVLSSIYMMRNLDFADKPAGSRLPMNIYLDRKIYSLDVIYAGKDDAKRIKGLGQCSALEFRPQLVVGNVFKDNEGMIVWVSNDDNKIPLMIESPISVGSVKAVLSEYSGLKYPAPF